MTSPRILVVDDEPEKVRLIATQIQAVEGIDPDRIDYVVDANAAKKLLKQFKYSLVILDMNLPVNNIDGPKKNGGLAVIDFIKTNRKAIRPSYLLGITAYDEEFSSAANEFSSPLWKLIKFKIGEDSWRKPLREALEFLVVQHRPPFFNDGNSYHVDLAIFAALEDIEMRSVLALDGGWREVNVSYDNTRYFLGEFTRGTERPISVVAVAAPNMGMPAAAVISSKVIAAFRPRYVAITGICAGVKGKTKIGDLLVADPIFDWGSGKWVAVGENKELRFQPAPYHWRVDERIRNRIKKVADAVGLLAKINEAFKGKKIKGSPGVIIDAMASGASVLQTAVLMDDVKDQHKNLVGVEMEIYAVHTAAEYASEPRPHCFSVKAVCDFGDDKKHKGYQAYAAHCSAQFIYELAIRELFAD